MEEKHLQLIQYYDDRGWRTGYLVKVTDERALVQPIGAKGRKPVKITVNLQNLRMIEKGETR